VILGNLAVARAGLINTYLHTYPQLFARPAAALLPIYPPSYNRTWYSYR
jgi:hypothetical protein